MDNGAVQARKERKWERGRRKERRRREHKFIVMRREEIIASVCARKEI